MTFYDSTTFASPSPQLTHPPAPRVRQGGERERKAWTAPFLLKVSSNDAKSLKSAKMRHTKCPRKRLLFKLKTPRGAGGVRGEKKVRQEGRGEEEGAEEREKRKEGERKEWEIREKWGKFTRPEIRRDGTKRKDITEME